MKNIDIDNRLITMGTLREQINKLSESVMSLGKVGLLVVEDDGNREIAFSDASKVFSELDYCECTDYLEIMDALSDSKKKLFYIEQGEKFDGLVLEIVAEFEAGIVSLADRKNQSGLKTAKWNPASAALIIIMTREQVEKSHPRLFEYINIIQSV